jgi:transposase
MSIAADIGAGGEALSNPVQSNPDPEPESKDNKNKKTTRSKGSKKPKKPKNGTSKPKKPPLTDEQKAWKKAQRVIKKAENAEKEKKKSEREAQKKANRSFKKAKDLAYRRAHREARQRTAWELTDAFYSLIEGFLGTFGGKPEEELKHKRGGGRPHKDFRKVLEAIFFVMRTGIQWKAIDKTVFGCSGSTVHHYFQVWTKNGVFEKMWKAGLVKLEERGLLDLEWQSVDGSLVKARLGGDDIGPNPTDRAKDGTKRSVLVEGGGIPIGFVLSGANVHDVKLLEKTLDSRLTGAPDGVVLNLCCDKGYDSGAARTLIKDKGYIPHVVPRGEEQKMIEEGKKARRWVVERAFSFMNFFRKVLVRYEKKSKNYKGLLQFACAFRCFRVLDLI